MFGEQDALFWVIFIPHMLLALSVHEASHAGAAFSLGDETAALMGRLSLNPLRHLDPIGTLAFVVVHFGWAKPVPVNPLRFRHPRRDDVLVSLAGPASNLAVGVLLLAAIRTVYLLGYGDEEAGRLAVAVLFVGAQLNVGLCFFNLIPVPPLDGSHLLMAALPDKVLRDFEGILANGWIILLGLILAGRYLGFSILGTVIGRPMSGIMKLLLGEDILLQVFGCLAQFKLI